MAGSSPLHLPTPLLVTSVLSWEDGARPARRNRRFKRAQTACRRCRAKKTKCDNQRPACGFCIERHVQCVYGDGAGAQGGVQLPRTEPTIREVFDRVEHIVNLLEFDRQPHTEALPPAAGPGRTRRPSASVPVPANAPGPFSPHPDSTHALPAGLSPSHVPRASTPAGISFESTLKWPIFREFASDQISSLVLQANLDVDERCCQNRVDDHLFGDGPSSLGAAPGNQATSFVLSDETYIPILCQRYLKVVHVKNPIFEVSTFNMHVKRVVEHGFDWGESSCVVMLACALASMVKQFQESSDGFGASVDPVDPSTSELKMTRPASADAYYLASKKRLGLLEVTLVSVQCFFLAGLYEMCCMRPASAWVHYCQACSRLQVILSQDKPADRCQSPDFHILERLYFSCYRTELDLREELQLPPSAITNLEFPTEFPSLPSWTSFLNGANHNVSNGSPNSECLPPNVVQQEEEQSWYYYLASIALRKQANSIVKLLYRPGEASWMEKVELTIHHAAFQESELDQWCTLLPAKLKFDTEEGASEDLAFILECRQLQWRQMSYRPLLYYALHRPNEDPYIHHVLPFAEKCLEYCALTIRRLLRPHHFEGTWFIQRTIATSTLLILAAQIRGPPLFVSGWKTLVSLSLQALAIWRAEAHDLVRARLILERILGKVSTERE